MSDQPSRLPGDLQPRGLEHPGRLSAIVAGISKGIALYRVVEDGRDVVFVDMNPAGCRLTGVSREAIVGRSVREVFPGVVDMGLFAVFLEVWRTGRRRHFPARRYEDERLATWFENEVFRLPTGEIVAVFEDATDRRRAEERLEESERRLQLAQHVGRLGFLDWDLVTDTIVWSDEVCRLAGVSADTPVRTVADTLALIHPDDRAGVVAAWRAAAQGGQAYDLVHRLVRPDGTTVWVHAQSLLERDLEGRPRRLLGTVVDITEVQETNQALRRLNEELEVRVAQRTASLERSNRELERFAHSVAHDLKAPLRAIQGFVDIILASHRQELSPSAAGYFEHVTEAAREMSRLVDDLLEYARIGGVPVHLRPLSLRAAVDRAWRRLEESGVTGSASLTVADHLPEVVADARLLEQILVHLLKNAVTFHLPEATPHVHVGARRTEEGVVLEVRDDGVGIEPRFHAIIFDAFQRLHPKDCYAGSGLGLTVVKRCADLMHAEVFVRSAPGAGSTFSVLFRHTPSGRAP